MASPEYLSYKIIQIIEGLGSAELNNLIAKNLIDSEFGRKLSPSVRGEIRKYFDVIS